MDCMWTSCVPIGRPPPDPIPCIYTDSQQVFTDPELTSTVRDPESFPTPASRDSEPEDAVSCTATDELNLISTITDEYYILWPNEEVVFTCETIGGSILVHEWTSDDYINNSLIFDSNNTVGDEMQSSSGSSVTLIRVDYNYVMVSQLRITTSSQFPMSTVTCTNFNGISKNITFSVLGIYLIDIVTVISYLFAF